MIKKLIRKMQTAAGGPLRLTPEELKYYSWINMSPELRRQNRNNRVKAYLSSAPSIGNFWEAFQTYIGNRDPKNPHLNTGEAPNPGMRNPTLILSGALKIKLVAQKVKSVAERAAKISDRVFDRQYQRAISSGNSKRVLAVRDLHFRAKAPNTPVVDINGNPQLVYHKTPEKFTIFDNNRSIGKLNWFATPNAYGENGVFATGAGKNPYTMKLYVNMKNPHKPTIDEGIEPAYINEGEDGILGIVDKDMTDYFSSSGDAGEGFMMSGGVNNPFALKLSNAVTRDNKGKIIPISLRDNFLINDIRYKQGGLIKSANARKWKHEDGGLLELLPIYGTYKDFERFKENPNWRTGASLGLSALGDLALFTGAGAIVKGITTANKARRAYRAANSAANLARQKVWNAGSKLNRETLAVNSLTLMNAPTKTIMLRLALKNLAKQNYTAALNEDNKAFNALLKAGKNPNINFRGSDYIPFMVTNPSFHAASAAIKKNGGTLKAQYGAPLNLSTEDIQGGLQYITLGLGKVWNIMNAPVVNVQPSTTASLPNSSQIEIPGTLIGVVDDSFGKGGGGKKAGKKLLQSVAKSKDKGLTVTKKVDNSVRHGLVNIDQDLRHFGRGNRRMDPEELIKEMDKHVEFKEFAKRLSKRLGNLNKDNPQAMKDFKALKNKYEDMFNDFLHNGIKKHLEGGLLELLPIYGTIKSGQRFFKNPSWGKAAEFGLSAVGDALMFTGIGAGAGAAIKAGKFAAKAGKVAKTAGAFDKINAARTLKYMRPINGYYDEATKVSSNLALDALANGSNYEKAASSGSKIIRKAINADGAVNQLNTAKNTFETGIGLGSGAHYSAYNYKKKFGGLLIKKHLEGAKLTFGLKLGNFANSDLGKSVISNGLSFLSDKLFNKSASSNLEIALAAQEKELPTIDPIQVAQMIEIARNQYADSDNPNANGGDIFNSYIKNQITAPILARQLEEHKKRLAAIDLLTNQAKSSAVGTFFNTLAQGGIEYLLNKYGTTEKADS